MPVARDQDAFYRGATPLDRVYRGDTEVWPMVDPAVIAVSSSRWDLAAISWNDMRSVDEYVLYRDGVEKYRGPLFSFNDTGLVPSTSYTYKIDGVKSGKVETTDSKPLTTAARTAPVVSSSTPRWDQVSLSWTDANQGSVDSYILKRASTQVYSGATKSFTETGAPLVPSTSYTYTLESYRAGVKILPDVTKAQTTAAHPDLGLSVSAVAYNQINLSWAAKVGTVDQFVTNYGGSHGTATSWSHTGLAASTGYSYTLDARRAGVTIRSDSGSATTPARPTSSASINGPAAITSGGWTSCTAQNCNGPAFNFPQAAYITSWNVLVWAYSGGTGYFNPGINGVARGGRTVTGGRAYQHVDGGNVYVGSGSKGTNANLNGGCSYSTEWDAYSGATWNYNVAVGTVNYWWYTARSNDDLMRLEPWWQETLADRVIHIASWQDGFGGTLAVRIHDKETEEVLVEWGTIPDIPDDIPQAPPPDPSDFIDLPEVPEE